MGLEPPRVTGRASRPLCCCLSATKGLSSAANYAAGSAKANQEEKAELVKWIKKVYC